MQIDHCQLIRDLRDLRLREGDSVLVHSSLSGLGRVQGGADAVIAALLEAVGEEGTVLFPTLTGSERDGPDHPPVIHVASTPCWTGTIPETSRRHAGAVRSVHPTYSVTAIGARAVELTHGHELSRTPCDPASPYTRLMEEGGKILLLGGVTHESNTSLHALEEMAGVPYHLQDEPTNGIVTLPDGQRVIVRNRLHLWRWPRNFSRTHSVLAAAGALTTGQVGASTSVLIDARAFRETLLPILRDDPLFLLNDDARREFSSS